MSLYNIRIVSRKLGVWWKVYPLAYISNKPT